MVTQWADVHWRIALPENFQKACWMNIEAVAMCAPVRSQFALSSDALTNGTLNAAYRPAATRTFKNGGANAFSAFDTLDQSSHRRVQGVS
jgi:hypothetical protein